MTDYTSTTEFTTRQWAEEKSLEELNEFITLRGGKTYKRKDHAVNRIVKGFDKTQG